MKDHILAKFINDLRDCAVEYGHTQQLRERIGGIVKDYVKSPWISIDTLPEIDEFVLFQCENGYVFLSHIDKDMDRLRLNGFLAGREHTGPIIRWMRVPE